METTYRGKVKIMAVLDELLGTEKISPSKYLILKGCVMDHPKGKLQVSSGEKGTEVAYLVNGMEVTFDSSTRSTLCFPPKND